jgi:ATP-binding cassette subfamily B protein
MEPARRPAPTPGGTKAVGRALGYLRKYRLETAGALVSLLLVSAANLSVPQLVRWAIDGGIAKGDRSAVLAAVGGLVGLSLARGLFNFLQGYLAERASQGVAFDLRDALFARIQRLSFSYYDQAQTGQLLTRLTNDVEQVRTFVGSGVVQLAAAVAMLVGCAVLLVLINPVLAVAALASILPILWLLRRFVGQMGPLFGSLQMQLGKLNTILQEDLRGLRCSGRTSRSSRRSPPTSRSWASSRTSARWWWWAWAGCSSSATA